MVNQACPRCGSPREPGAAVCGTCLFEFDTADDPAQLPASSTQARFDRRRMAVAVGVAVLGVLVVFGVILIGGNASPTAVDPVGSAAASSHTTPAPSPRRTPAPTASPPTWAFTGSLATPRTSFTATLLGDGTVLVAGGGRFAVPYSNPETLDSAELYDPDSGTWTPAARMVEARYGHTATLLPNGTVLVAGGSSWSEAGETTLLVTSAELYDPRSGTWTAIEGMLEARWSGHTATLLPDGTVLVAGGFVNTIGRGLVSAELYDPATGAWSGTGNMTEERFGHTATLLPNGTVLVAGGSGTGRASAELYDPRTRTWTTTGNLVEARQLHTATLLPDGTVLVAGGQRGDGLASAERYDPRSGIWTATGTMIAARYLHTATLLPDGTVLVAGGAIGGFAVASAELYDLGGGLWVPTSSMNAVRSGHTATLLTDGRTLVVGGADLAAAELYETDPGT